MVFVASVGVAMLMDGRLKAAGLMSISGIAFDTVVVYFKGFAGRRMGRQRRVRWNGTARRGGITMRSDTGNEWRRSMRLQFYT
jgi:hypothetical protein